MINFTKEQIENSNKLKELQASNINGCNSSKIIELLNNISKVSKELSLKMKK